MARGIPNREAYIEFLIAEGARYKRQRDEAKAQLDEITAKYEAQAPLLADAVERLARYENRD